MSNLIILKSAVSRYSYRVKKDKSYRQPCFYLNTKPCIGFELSKKVFVDLNYNVVKEIYYPDSIMVHEKNLIDEEVFNIRNDIPEWVLIEIF